MYVRPQALLSIAILSGLLAACSDVTNPSRPITPVTPSFSGGTVADTSLVSGGGGGGGGHVVVDTPCGSLTTSVTTTQILVYTVRTGIGFSGQATNCSLRTRETFDVAIVDQEANAACSVSVPHFIAARNTSPGGVLQWAATSLPVNCPNTLHTFTVTLKDSQTGTVFATSTAQIFL
jgi:hypothetical protein